jgi:hypothetical protein
MSPVVVVQFKNILRQGPNGCPGYTSATNTAATEMTAAMYSWVLSLKLWKIYLKMVLYIDLSTQEWMRKYIFSRSKQSLLTHTTSTTTKYISNASLGFLESLTVPKIKKSTQQHTHNQHKGLNQF